MNTIDNKNTKNSTTVEVVGNYYIHDGCYYDIHFPLHYAMTHIEGTGPKDCNNCLCYGSWRGVFIGYCFNCAQYNYDLKRGHGFYEPGLEQYRGGEDNSSAFDTYLKHVCLDKVGNYGDGDKLDLLDRMGFPISLDQTSRNKFTFVDVDYIIRSRNIDPDYLPDRLINALKSGDVNSFIEYDRVADYHEDDDDYYGYRYKHDDEYYEDYVEDEDDLQNEPAFKDHEEQDRQSDDTENRIIIGSTSKTIDL